MKYSAASTVARTALWLILAGTALPIGCAPKPPITPVVNDLPATSTEVTETQSAPLALEATSSERSGIATATSNGMHPAATIPEPADATDEGAASAPDATADRPPDPERILILARGGPLLLDFWLTIDGQPFEANLAALVQRMLSAGDAAGDGRPTWSEWRKNEAFLRGELAHLTSVQDRRLRQWIERFDENKDDQLQPTEAAAWLGRERGRSAAPLTLRSSRTYFTLGSTHSRLWRLLDADGDTRLRADELALASERLLRLDTNNDRIITAAELATLRDQLDAQSGQRMTFADRSARPAAIYLKDASEASRLDYVLGDLYAPRQQLGPASFPARARLFAALDDDGNQRLDSTELAALLKIEPHARLSLDFSWDDETRSATTQLTLQDHAQEVEAVIEPAANRRVLITGDIRLIVSAHDLRDSQRTDQVAQRSQIRLMVHDRGDGLFDAIDSNANGRLDEREIAAAADRMLECDANGDRKLTADELLVSMTVAFLRSEPAGEQSFYVPSSDSTSAAAASGQESDPPAWFRYADFNGDRDLSRGEFLGSSAQFATLDTNQDGFISADEASSSR